jgi:hypothetical protein
MLNNRPLSMTSIEDTTNEYLTPNQFLMLRGNFQNVPLHDNVEQKYVKEWKDIKLFTHTLWKHFSEVYLEEIKYENKWHEKKSKFEKGDIVIVPDPTISNLWRLGKIIDTQKGSNDQTRKVTITLGKRNELKNKKNKKDMIDEYKKENMTIIERAAHQIAKLKDLKQE